MRDTFGTLWIFWIQYLSILYSIVCVAFFTSVKLWTNSSTTIHGTCYHVRIYVSLWSSNFMNTVETDLIVREKKKLKLRLEAWTPECLLIITDDLGNKRDTSWHVQAAAPDQRPLKTVHPHHGFNYCGWVWWRSFTTTQWTCGWPHWVQATARDAVQVLILPQLSRDAAGMSNMIQLCCVLYDLINNRDQSGRVLLQKADLSHWRDDKHKVSHSPRLASGLINVCVCVYKYMRGRLHRMFVC